MSSGLPGELVSVDCALFGSTDFILGSFKLKFSAAPLTTSFSNCGAMVGSFYFEFETLSALLNSFGSRSPRGNFTSDRGTVSVRSPAACFYVDRSI